MVVQYTQKHRPMDEGREQPDSPIESVCQHFLTLLVIFNILLAVPPIRASCTHFRFWSRSDPCKVHRTSIQHCMIYFSTFVEHILVINKVETYRVKGFIVSFYLHILIGLKLSNLCILIFTDLGAVFLTVCL